MIYDIKELGEAYKRSDSHKSSLNLSRRLPLIILQNKTQRTGFKLPQDPLSLPQMRDEDLHWGYPSPVVPDIEAIPWPCRSLQGANEVEERQFPGLQWKLWLLCYLGELMGYQKS